MTGTLVDMGPPADRALRTSLGFRRMAGAIPPRMTKNLSLRAAERR